MQLSLTPPCSCSWLGMLLLVSSLLLWEHVNSTSNDQLSDEELYKKILGISQFNHLVAREMHRSLDVKLSERRQVQKSGNHTCLTASIPTPKKKKDILKVIINVTSTWTSPLKLLISATLTHLASYKGMLSNVTEVEYGNKEVLKGAKILLSKIEPGFEANGKANWPELKLMWSSNEDIHLLAFYKLFSCLKKDTKKVYRYINNVTHRVLKNNK